MGGNKSETVKLRQPNLNAMSNPSKMHVAAEVASELFVRRDPRIEAAETVQVKRIDDIDFGKRGPNIIKVDVESMELALVQGATEVLHRYRPTLYIEDSHSLAGSGRTP